MQLATPNIERTCPEAQLIAELLSLDGKHLIELGCGRAELTRALAAGPGRNVLATEVDALQHAKNLALDDLPNVTFVLGGAEAIPAPDASADVVFMFKSLHHVPVAAMDQALAEVRRVLVPGGVAWLSEPLFAGDFNAIVRLFHDEERVRAAAFEAIERAVDGGLLELEREIFFNSPRRFADFADFEAKVLQVTHTQHELDDALYDEVRRRFEAQMGTDGVCFLTPNRLDLLVKPG